MMYTFKYFLEQRLIAEAGPAPAPGGMPPPPPGGGGLGPPGGLGIPVHCRAVRVAVCHRPLRVVAV
jgi:hypothetical protein